MGTLPPALGRGEDSWSWGEEPNGKFSIRSAYCLILELNNPSSDPNWDRVWRWRGPSRIQHFLWLVLHNKLLTNAERSRRHLTNNSSCPRCYNLEESVKSLGQVTPTRMNTEIVWDPGPDGWVTLNTDGSVNHSTGSATAGGLLRNHLGHCSAAFSANLGKCSITRAELRGIFHGLDIAWREGHKQVRVQPDSQTAVSLILADDAPLRHHASEVLAIRELLQRNWKTEIHHIYREANGAADFLASKGYSLGLGVHSFRTSDCNLGYFLRKDCMQNAEFRSISMRI
ncbi:Putative ribonuclease H protein At1g65750 [Linum perenne]